MFDSFGRVGTRGPTSLPGHECIPVCLLACLPSCTVPANECRWLPGELLLEAAGRRTCRHHATFVHKCSAEVSALGFALMTLELECTAAVPTSCHCGYAMGPIVRYHSLPARTLQWVVKKKNRSIAQNTPKHHDL
jgi:hypothetical protein